MPAITFDVVAVGMRFNAGPSFNFTTVQSLALVPEPTNKHDENAVKVVLINEEEESEELRNRHVAYIGRNYSKHVCEILNDGGTLKKIEYIPDRSTSLAACLVLHCDVPERLIQPFYNVVEAETSNGT